MRLFLQPPLLSHRWSSEWSYHSAACRPPAATENSQPRLCEVSHKDESAHACWMQPGAHLTGCYDRSYGLRQPPFSFISLSRAERDNKVENRGWLRFFEYMSSFIHEGGYLSSAVCLQIHECAAAERSDGDSLMLLGTATFLCQQVLNLTWMWTSQCFKNGWEWIMFFIYETFKWTSPLRLN